GGGRPQRGFLPHTAGAVVTGRDPNVAGGFGLPSRRRTGRRRQRRAMATLASSRVVGAGLAAPARRGPRRGQAAAKRRFDLAHPPSHLLLPDGRGIEEGGELPKPGKPRFKGEME